MASELEHWLRGPVPGVPAELQAVAHALLQACDDLAAAAAPLNTDQLWTSPGGIAPVGFHLVHAAGSLGRLLTYARGEQLTHEQFEALKAEKAAAERRPDRATLVANLNSAIARALDQVRTTAVASLADERRVGRQALPSTVRGLLFHAAEHAARHAGQATTTSKIVRAGALGGP